ncbi:MAG: hypothetical protein OXU23_03480 [Candidatus Poribacteria bacterium]|nr:hypothetical protein [Candidatus Poribacteria bacterium]
MLSRYGKFLLTISAFLPVFATIAIQYISKIECIKQLNYGLDIVLSVTIFGLTCLISYGICYRRIQNSLEIEAVMELPYVEFERSDQGIITFIILYLFPFLRAFTLVSVIQCILLVFAFFFIIYMIIDTNSYQCNPFIRFCGYRMYIVKNDENKKFLLLVSTPLVKATDVKDVKPIAEDVYIVP